MIQRNILPKLLGELDKPFVSILIGPRQVGKTILPGASHVAAAAISGW